MADTYSLKTRLSSSKYGSSSGTSSHLNGRTCTVSHSSRKDVGRSQRSHILKDSIIDLSEASQDPFAFSCDDSGKDACLSQRSYILQDSKIDLSEESQDPFAFSYDDSGKDASLSQRSYISEDSKIDLSQESQDPFAFDEGDFEPSKWDILYGKKKRSQSQKNGTEYRELDDSCQLQLIMNQEASTNGENHQTHEASCSGGVSSEGSSLLADCLLAAVKVILQLNVLTIVSLF